jgi:protein Mpv17
MTNAPKSGIAVATKTAIDQLLWAPIFTSIFFSFMKTVEGHPDQVVDEVKTKLWPTMKVNWGVWPLAHLINFRFVPSSQRILYINSVQIGYNTFLSTMAAAKTKEETPAA